MENKHASGAVHGFAEAMNQKQRIEPDKISLWEEVGSLYAVFRLSGATTGAKDRI
jgi:hypothetical protein